MSNYYSFDELKDELGLSEDEIKKMVSEGELRAFRDQDKMKFKREDVEALRRQKRGSRAGIDDDDIILLDDSDDAPSSTRSGAGRAPAGRGRGRGDVTEELLLEDDDDFSVGGTEALDTQDTFVEGDIGGVTEPIEVIDDDDEEADLPPVVASGGSRRMAASRPRASSRIAIAPPSTGTPWVTGVQIALCAVLIYSSALVYGLVSDHNPGATRWLTDIVFQKMNNNQLPAKRTLGESR